jgi:hypothetical protein
MSYALVRQRMSVYKGRAYGPTGQGRVSFGEGFEPRNWGGMSGGFRTGGRLRAEGLRGNRPSVARSFPVAVRSGGGRSFTGIVCCGGFRGGRRGRRCRRFRGRGPVRSRYAFSPSLTLRDWVWTLSNTRLASGLGLDSRQRPHWLRDSIWTPASDRIGFGTRFGLAPATALGSGLGSDSHQQPFWLPDRV